MKAEIKKIDEVYRISVNGTFLGAYIGFAKLFNYTEFKTKEEAIKFIENHKVLTF